MSLVGLLVLVLCLWLALKVAGFFLRVVLWIGVLVGLYWLLAPMLGMPRPV